MYLSFQKGDVIQVIHTSPSGWWAGLFNDDSEVGWFPCSFVTIIPVEAGNSEGKYCQLKVVITSSEFLTSLVLLLIQSCLVTVTLVFEQVLGLSKQECFTYSAPRRVLVSNCRAHPPTNNLWLTFLFKVSPLTAVGPL